MKAGQILTLADFNTMFRNAYRFMNDMVPALAITITTGQIVYEGVSSSDPANGRQYPSKYGEQFFADDSTGFLTADIVERINRAVGE